MFPRVTSVSGITWCHGHVPHRAPRVRASPTHWPPTRAWRRETGKEFDLVCGCGWQLRIPMGRNRTADGGSKAIHCGPSTGDCCDIRSGHNVDSANLQIASAMVFAMFLPILGARSRASYLAFLSVVQALDILGQVESIRVVRGFLSSFSDSGLEKKQAHCSNGYRVWSGSASFRIVGHARLRSRASPVISSQRWEQFHGQ